MLYIHTYTYTYTYTYAYTYAYLLRPPSPRPRRPLPGILEKPLTGSLERDGPLKWVTEDIYIYIYIYIYRRGSLVVSVLSRVAKVSGSIPARAN